MINTCYIIFKKWSKSLFKLHFVNVKIKLWFNNNIFTILLGYIFKTVNVLFHNTKRMFHNVKRFNKINFNRIQFNAYQWKIVPETRNIFILCYFKEGLLLLNVNERILFFFFFLPRTKNKQKCAKMWGSKMWNVTYNARNIYRDAVRM